MARTFLLTLVALVAVATVGVFTFAKPQYRPQHTGATIRFDEATPPAHGWAWDDPTPGFHFREHDDAWNVSVLEPRDVPAGAGVLAAMRTAMHQRPAVLYTQDGSCIGVQPHVGARVTFCDPHGFAILYAEAVPLAHNVFLMGITRSDVSRVTVNGRLADVRAQNRWWGTFPDTLGTWRATLAFFSKHGRLGTLRLDFTKPGERIYCASALRGACGMSAHRRS